MNTIVNFLAFVAGWFGCVLGAAAGYPWVGVIIVLMVAALHLSIVARPATELRLMGLALLVGLVVDSLLVAGGFVTYDEGNFASGFAPYWIIFMWVGFSTTWNGSMRFLRGRPVLAMLFGALAGPGLYALGMHFGALEFSTTLSTLLVLSAVWAVVVPLVVKLGEHLDGTTVPGEPSSVTWLTS